MRIRTLLGSAAIVGAAAGLGGMTTFATFTDTAGTATSDPTIASGTVDINIGAAGADNRLTIGATALVPGDSLQRRAKLTNAGTEALASTTLTTTATTSSVLDTDGTDGLKMKIEECTTGTWTESASTPYTYTCDLIASSGLNNGTRTTVLAQRAIIGTTIALTGMATAAGGVDDMVITVDLPSAAGNGFQNKTSTIDYTFNAIQRAATSK